jgi:hypothetical protein
MRISRAICGNFGRAADGAFFSEVDAGSHRENATKQKTRAPFRFYRSGKGSRERDRSKVH